MMVFGYPLSCRSTGIIFGAFMSRLGAIAASGFGGVLVELGGGSVIPFFGFRAIFPALFVTAAFVIDRNGLPEPSR